MQPINKLINQFFLKSKWMEKNYIILTLIKGKQGVAILIPDKTSFKVRKDVRDKAGHYKMIKE